MEDNKKLFEETPVHLYGLCPVLYAQRLGKPVWDRRRKPDLTPAGH